MRSRYSKQRPIPRYIAVPSALALLLFLRLELVMETMRRLALEELAAKAPGWLRQVARPHWVERYSMVWRGKGVPQSKEKRAELASSVGKDDAYLLGSIADKAAPERTIHLPTVEQLRKVWQQHKRKGNTLIRDF